MKSLGANARHLRKATGRQGPHRRPRDPKPDRYSKWGTSQLHSSHLKSSSHGQAKQSFRTLLNEIHTPFRITLANCRDLR